MTGLCIALLLTACSSSSVTAPDNPAAPAATNPAAPASGVTSVQLDPNAYAIVIRGQFELRATARDGAGNVVDGAQTAWRTSNPGVLELSDEGATTAVVSARQLGGADVIVTIDGVERTLALVVVDSTAVSSVSVPNPVASLEPGGSFQLDPFGQDAAAREIRGMSFAFESSEPAVATVTTAGVVRAVGGGTAQVTAQAMGQVAAVSVTVDGPTADAPPPAAPPSGGELAAFPGAEGYGALALSSCRTLPLQVHHVTTLDSYGNGSLTDIVKNKFSDYAFDIVVFDIGGTITTKEANKIVNSCVYIAGQTAPGGGVQIRSPEDSEHQVTPFVFERYRQGHDVVLRYLRLRPGKGKRAAADAIQMVSGYRIVIDHVSTAFDNDKGIAMFPASRQYNGQELNDVSVQWSMITTSLKPHSTGNLIGGDADEPDVTNISVHHNAYINNSHRNPMIKRVKCAQVVNNLVYNWRSRVGYTMGHACVDFVGNYYRKGPGSDPRILGHQILNDEPEYRDDPRLFLSANVVDPDELDPALDQTRLIRYAGDRSGELPASVFTGSPNANPVVPITSSSAAGAYSEILASSGAAAKLSCSGVWVDNRDVLDQLLISQVRDRSGPEEDQDTDHQNDYGGYPSLLSGTTCADSDGDGMPDDFERVHGLADTDASDAVRDRDGDGYLNIEEYLNGTTP